jgi:hypothetical protein
LRSIAEQQSDLLQVLGSYCQLIHQLGKSGNSRRELSQRLSEFAEFYIETETAQAELFNAAFPSPSWTSSN